MNRVRVIEEYVGIIHHEGWEWSGYGVLVDPANFTFLTCLHNICHPDDFLRFSQDNFDNLRKNLQDLVKNLCVSFSIKGRIHKLRIKSITSCGLEKLMEFGPSSYNHDFAYVELDGCPQELYLGVLPFVLTDDENPVLKNRIIKVCMACPRSPGAERSHCFLNGSIKHEDNSAQWMSNLQVVRGYSGSPVFFQYQGKCYLFGIVCHVGRTFDGHHQRDDFNVSIIPVFSRSSNKVVDQQGLDYVQKHKKLIQAQMEKPTNEQLTRELLNLVTFVRATYPWSFTQASRDKNPYNFGSRKWLFIYKSIPHLTSFHHIVPIKDMQFVFEVLMSHLPEGYKTIVDLLKFSKVGSNSCFDVLQSQLISNGGAITCLTGNSLTIIQRSELRNGFAWLPLNLFWGPARNHRSDEFNNGDVDPRPEYKYSYGNTSGIVDTSANTPVDFIPNSWDAKLRNFVKKFCIDVDLVRGLGSCSNYPARFLAAYLLMNDLKGILEQAKRSEFLTHQHVLKQKIARTWDWRVTTDNSSSGGFSIFELKK